MADRPRRAPVARALPDRFVVVVQQGAQSGTAVGSAIPPEVVVSLPRDDDPTTLATLGGATLGPGMEWLADYDEAKKIGLGIDVALPVPGAAVDLLLAFGVRSTLDPASSSSELELLLRAHRYSDGAAVPAQGSPTNNTETDRSAWSKRADPLPPPTRSDELEPAPGSAAAQIASALGIDPSTLAGIDGGGRDEQDPAGGSERRPMVCQLGHLPRPHGVLAAKRRPGRPRPGENPHHVHRAGPGPRPAPGPARGQPAVRPAARQ